MKKKLISLTIGMILTVILSVPAFAYIKPGDMNRYIYAWKGTGMAALTDCGVGNIITVNTSVSTRHSWAVVAAPHGNYRITHNGNDVNIYRVLQNGIYYLCTAYPYENATQGRDQRIEILGGDSFSQVRLAQPLIGGEWYMMPDRSAASSLSDVIWYTASTEMRAFWI